MRRDLKSPYIVNKKPLEVPKRIFCSIQRKNPIFIPDLPELYRLSKSLTDRFNLPSSNLLHSRNLEANSVVLGEMARQSHFISEIWFFIGLNLLPKVSFDTQCTKGS